MICTRCDGTGYLNIEQVDDDTLRLFDATSDPVHIESWIESQLDDHDVEVCDCCGNGEIWYGERGQHYGTIEDQRGHDGPYAYNGGLCECN